VHTIHLRVMVSNLCFLMHMQFISRKSGVKVKGKPCVQGGKWGIMHGNGESEEKKEQK